MYLTILWTSGAIGLKHRLISEIYDLLVNAGDRSVFTKLVNWKMQGHLIVFYIYLCIIEKELFPVQFFVKLPQRFFLKVDFTKAVIFSNFCRRSIIHL